MITASCGHKLTEEEGMGCNVMTADYDKRGNRVVSYRVVCTKCKDFMAKENRLLTEEQADQWLHRKLKLKK